MDANNLINKSWLWIDDDTLKCNYCKFSFTRVENDEENYKLKQQHWDDVHLPTNDWDVNWKIQDYEYYGSAIDHFLCERCGYSFGRQNVGSTQLREALKELSDEHQQLHRRVCMPGQFEYGGYDGTPI